jgi:Rieske Fe-S protein
VRKLATLGIAIFVGALVTGPALAMMIAPAFLDQGVKAHDLGPLAEFPQGEFVRATFTADPSQGTVSRTVAYVRNNGVVSGETSFTLLSGRSSFLGCPVQPNGPTFPEQATRYKDVTLLPLAPKGFGSSCHPGVQYDNEGNPTGGPTDRALDRYTYSIRGGHVFMGRPYSVSRVDGTGAAAKIHAVPFAFPGEPVSGVESWLYPLRPGI